MSDNINQDTAIRGEGNIVVGKGDVIINLLPPAKPRLRRDLGVLLKNVETTWIKGALERSVHEAALLELGMELREEAVDNPWRMVMEKPDQSREVLPQGKKIKDIFDEANRLLLILGEPGSGKTTTLLQLARDLIAEVDEAFTQPVPVILNLSTWTNKQQHLDEWLIGELNSKYRVPIKDGKKWLRDRRVLPLLDGLDEVRAEDRAPCVEEINQLVNDYGLQGLVVCSRIKDYGNLHVRLAFDRAIYLQPLTDEQVDEYLDQAGDKLASLRAMLQVDEALRSMAQSPLILNIMSLAYQNTSAEALSDPALVTNRARRKNLFDTYINRMFNRTTRTQDYEEEQTKQHLSWLAWNMQKQNQDIFLIEGLQPSWLRTIGWRILYILASRLLGGLIFGLFFALIGPIFLTGHKLIDGLIIGLCLGLPFIIIDLLRFEWLGMRRGRKTVPDLWWTIINFAIAGLIFALIFGTLGLAGLENGQIFWKFSYDVLIVILFAGLTGGLFVGIRGSRKTFMNDIQPVEALRWYWRKALRNGLTIGLLGGLLARLFFWLLELIEIIGPSGAVYSSLLVALISGLISAIFYGLSPEIIETKTTPNQGIRLSVRYAVYGGLIVGLIGGLLVGLIGELNGGRSLAWAQFGAPIIGLLAAFWYGGLDAIQHYTLRLLLVIQGRTPGSYAHFLDYAVDRIFLQKVGGGYRFIHRLLLEHFADMYETSE